MEWITGLMYASFGIFILQFLGSLFLDIDDYDVDDNLFSFKGIVHFLMGFSLTMHLFGIITLVSVSTSLIVGLIFLFLTSLIYIGVYKLKKEINYTVTIEESTATVYYWSGKEGSIQIVLEGRLTEIKCSSEEEINLKINEQIIVSGTRDHVKFIKKLN